MSAGPRITALLAELEHEREAFNRALAAVPNPEGRRVVENWDARDLVVHAAFWSEHGADALELAATGRGDAFDYDSGQTDTMNAATAAAGHASSIEHARAREEAAYQRFHRALAELDEALLDLQLGNGDLVEDVVRYDGPDHYAEHAAHLRAATR
jgi:hypothetical protein